MIQTGSYKNCNNGLYATISISGDRGKGVNYKGSFFKELAPKLSFWEV